MVSTGKNDPKMAERSVETGLHSSLCGLMLRVMGLPTQAVTLTPEQVSDLSRRLSSMRHDINNYLSLIVAAAELIKMNAELAGRMSVTLSEQPAKISEEIRKFSAAFDDILGINRD